MHDDARGAEARLHNGHIVYARLFQDATKDSGRVPYANKEVIPPTLGDSTRIIDSTRANFIIS